MFYITGTVVGNVKATDRDKEGSLHVKIRYTLLNGLDLFAIHPETGVITTVTSTLDREVSTGTIVLMIYPEIPISVSCLILTCYLPFSCIILSHFFFR